VLNLLANIEQFQNELNPLGFVLEFLVSVFVVERLVWGLFQKRSPVFWKMTDYAYFFVTILGGATAAADLAISSWTREAQQIQISILSTLGDIKTNIESVVVVCNKK
jgi:hypothetical protein